MWEHLQVKHTRDGGASDGNFSEPIFTYVGELGRAGWEMVAATTLANGALVMFFKRPFSPTTASVAVPPAPEGLTAGYL